MLRILTTNVTRELQASATHISELKTVLAGRIDDTNKRIDDTTAEMHQRFDRVHQELGENRQRRAKLEGALEGFLAERRDRDAA